MKQVQTILETVQGCNSNKIQQTIPHLLEIKRIIATWEIVVYFSSSAVTQRKDLGRS